MGVSCAAHRARRKEIGGEAKPHVGFNAATEIYEDLVAAGVIDPAKVVRSALQNAASVASLLLTTEALISSIPDTNGARGHGPGGCTDAVSYLAKDGNSD